MTLLLPEKFDLRRAVIYEPPPSPTLTIAQTIPFVEALDSGQIRPDTRVMLIDSETLPLVFHTLYLTYFQIVQGETGGVPWMVAYCPACNGASAFDRRVERETFQFQMRGVYDAMIILSDLETDSYWDHIHGTGLYGAHEGKRLTRAGMVLHATAREVLGLQPTARYALITPDAESTAEAQRREAWSRQAHIDDFPDWIESMGSEDTRLPRLDMGLGVWTRETSRYYPMRTVHLHDNAVFDSIDGRGLVVYVAPDTHAAHAFYTDATGGTWVGDELRLDNGLTVRDGGVYTRSGTWVRVERPMQLLQRWFGFSYKFPRSPIYVGQAGAPTL